LSDDYKVELTGEGFLTLLIQASINTAAQKMTVKSLAADYEWLEIKMPKSCAAEYREKSVRIIHP
jgi:hypothetical protein